MTMTVRHRGDPREAWEYTGAPLTCAPGWVQNCVERAGPGHHVLVRRSGRQELKPGEIVLRNLDGEPEHYTDKAAFWAKFERFNG